MNTAIIIFGAGISSVFVGMSLLYLVIKVTPFITRYFERQKP